MYCLFMHLRMEFFSLVVVFPIPSGQFVSLLLGHSDRPPSRTIDFWPRFDLFPFKPLSGLQLCWYVCSGISAVVRLHVCSHSCGALPVADVSLLSLPVAFLTVHSQLCPHVVVSSWKRRSSSWTASCREHRCVAGNFISTVSSRPASRSHNDTIRCCDVDEEAAAVECMKQFTKIIDGSAASSSKFTGGMPTPVGVGIPQAALNCTRPVFYFWYF